MSKHITPWGKRCKVQMVMLDKSLADISKETGYTRPYISSVINGRQIASAEAYKKISEVLQVDIGLLV